MVDDIKQVKTIFPLIAAHGGMVPINAACLLIENPDRLFRLVIRPGELGQPGLAQAGIFLRSSHRAPADTADILTHGILSDSDKDLVVSGFLFIGQLPDRA
jgi:hypothetical protein